MRVHKYSIDEIKKWRKEQHEQGKPDGLRDFYVAHGSCPDCMGLGGWHHDKTFEWVNCPDCKGTGEVKS